MSRRVVVTGVGLVCGCGIGTEEVWTALQAGKSGIGPVTHFDVSAFDCRIAGEVKNFDPLNWVEKKELKKMARFIQLALAASDFAVRMAGLKVDAGDRRRSGRLYRFRHRRIRRDRARALQVSQRRPGQHLSVFHSRGDHQSCLRPRFHPLWRQGPELRDGHGLLSLGARHRRRFQNHSALRCRSDDRGRLGSGDHADGHRRLCRHARAFHAQRRT